MNLKLVLQWLPCQATGVTGSALGLVSLVSVYCFCVTVCFASSGTARESAQGDLGCTDAGKARRVGSLRVPPPAWITCSKHLLVGPVVKVSAFTVAELGSIFAFTVGIFPARVIPVNLKLVLQWLPCHATGVTGSALGLVSLVSVYCYCVR